MATTGRQSPDADALASSLRDAGFVRLAPAATGDGIGAAGVLAKTLDAIDIPFQISVVTDAAPTRATEADLVVALDRASPDADATIGEHRAASAAAFDVARTLACEHADPALAAAGTVAAGAEPTGTLTEALIEAGIERRPGVAVPTDDLADGLAHSTLVHAPFSGDPDAVRDVLETATRPDDEETRRQVASRVALETIGAEGATARAATAVEGVLRPHAGGPFGTVGGYGDVLRATAREDPGTAVALALGHDVQAAALEAWRRHASAAHETLHAATVRRHAGLVVVGADGPIRTVARLLGAFRSPEALTLVHDGDRIGLAAARKRDATAVLESATASFDLSGQVTGDADLATQPYPGDIDALVTAIREVIRDE
ncbi:recombinase RecJ [Halorhabdus sp. CBA1104]|uniref:recombinase RecJ n=1 Tax=Halorhabdus sp. CBA1104 TaxID=1380432 RepID=UPI0012B41FEE|nr:recombinase RecJ [Halorhabdus sp. CBA1104]QGN07486.1 recombinase RecJ [Halorhabdus sp. CBA1104]